MKHARQDWESTEERHLAAFATKSGKSFGRRHDEDPHPLRSCFARDRDRIFHSRCFRRLEYKTQVFVNGTADHYRTRLTHTMEMSAVGRTLARTLGANEDLTECICLAHDIGHSPFGHAGEEALDELMTDHGGFDHNLQSLRCIEVVESPYPGFHGLNLTWEVRAGLLKHEAHIEGALLDGHPIGPFQSIEAQIADIADDMTYHAHDVDDGLEAGIVTLQQLESTEFWRVAASATRGRSSGSPAPPEARTREPGSCRFPPGKPSRSPTGSPLILSTTGCWSSTAAPTTAGSAWCGSTPTPER